MKATTVSPSEWSKGFSICDGKYNSSTGHRCSPLAPFDSPMNILIHMGIGTRPNGNVRSIMEWCGVGVNQSDYDLIEERGVEIEIISISVYSAALDECVNSK